jgi:hypothetical protein
MHLAIFTYYFPPDNSVGVRRVSYWVDFFTKNDIKLTIFTVARGKIPDNVFRIPELSIYVITFSGIKLYDKDVHNKFSDNKIINESKRYIFLKNFKRQFINPFLGQIFDLRIFYTLICLIHFFFNKKKYRNITHIIATTPPYFVVTWAIVFKYFNDVKFILDYRDQFSNNDMFSGKFKFLEEKLDRFFCSKADLVTVVSHHIKDYYSLLSKNVKVVYNGFDESRFASSKEDTISLDNKFIKFCYVGSILHKSRMPIHFIDFLSKSNFTYCVEFIGEASIIEAYISEKYPSILNNFIFQKRVPFEQIPVIISSADINLVFEEMNPKSKSQFGTIPTKIYEYIASTKPIISEMSPLIEGHDILVKSGLLIHNFTDYNQPVNLSKKLIPDMEFIKSFSRYNSTKLLCDSILEINDK